MDEPLFCLEYTSYNQVKHLWIMLSPKINYYIIYKLLHLILGQKVFIVGFKVALFIPTRIHNLTPKHELISPTNILLIIYNTIIIFLSFNISQKSAWVSQEVWYPVIILIPSS
jgi:hypothetical protein